MKNTTEVDPNTREEGKEEKARCEWDFNLSTVISSNFSGEISDTIGVVEFDPSEHIFATGGIARKIRLYTLNSVLQAEGLFPSILDHNSVCDFYICTPAKLSSLRWKPNSGSRIIGSGDYDGVITEYDLEHRVPVFERDEHEGRRVWSIDYSHCTPTLAASGSDDGSMHLWDAHGGVGVAVVRPAAGGRSPVCSVEFEPSGGSLVAIGCVDKCAYLYDVRQMSGPVAALRGHRKTVTYVRFFGGQDVVSAGIDGCLKLWDMHEAHAIRTYEGHTNTRRFVGLSVWRNGGLMGCGSESNEVFVYDRRWSEPVWTHGFDPTVRTSCGDRFVSSVCWRQACEDECTLVAGGSDGSLQVFVGKKKSKEL